MYDQPTWIVSPDARRPGGGGVATTTMAAARNGVLQLALCALAIYTAFLVWGLLQEKITSTVYHTGDPLDAFRVGERFEYGVLLNGVQALCSCVMAMAYLMYLSLIHI